MRRPSLRGARGQRGSITVTAVACICMVLLLCLFVADVGMFLAARGRAQDAADAAALAGVQESFYLFSSGRGAQAAAADMARDNGAELERVDVSAGGERVEVSVSVGTPSLLLNRLGAFPDSVSARAGAEVDIDALLASGSIWFTPDPSTLAGIRAALAAAIARGLPGTSSTVVLLALSHLGKPYVWGATGPASFDCSGLVCYVFAQAGIRLPRTTFAQALCGRAVSTAELVPGDLVLFRRNNHVGIYIGAGCYVHAPCTGDVVKVSALSSRRDISACRRIL